MSYITTSCFPEANCYTGSLILNENQESLPIIADIIFLAGSTLLYPALLSVTFFIELYLMIDYSIHTYKSYCLKKKINKLTIISNDEFEIIKNQRLQKLETKKLAQHAKMIKTVNASGNLWPHLNQDEIIDKIKESHEAIEKQPSSKDFRSIANRTILREKIKVIRAYERIIEEIHCYKDKSIDEIKKIFSEKHKFSLIRHQINQRIDSHYLHNLLIVQVPVIGLVWLSHSKYTTKTSLEKTSLIDQYENTLTQYSWFKPY